jgi:WD40 repeat protein
MEVSCDAMHLDMHACLQRFQEERADNVFCLSETSFKSTRRLWDTASGQCLKSLVDESHPPASHALFTPNSRYALVSSLDSTIRLWDYHAAVCVKTYKAHENVK